MALDNDNATATKYLINKYFGGDEMATFLSYTPYLTAWSEIITKKKKLQRLIKMPNSQLVSRKNLDRQADYEVLSFILTEHTSL